jgi:leucine-rich PPR motif-containing protein, mitochondrial
LNESNKIILLGGSIGILESSPELSDQFEKIAIKYAQKNNLGPLNVLWMHYLVNHDPKAEGIFKSYLADSPRLMFQKVIQAGRDKQDEKLVQNLIDLLHGTKVSEGAIGNAHSCLLDIYAAKDNADGCLKAVESSLKDVSFENINRTALLRAKECVEKAGKKFPHTIPEKKTSNQQDSSSSSSSSSSDDEVTQKKKS